MDDEAKAQPQKECPHNGKRHWGYSANPERKGEEVEICGVCSLEI